MGQGLHAARPHGAYLAVLQPGTIRPDDTIEVVWRPGHGITLPMVFRAWMGDRDLARAVLDSGALPAREHRSCRQAGQWAAAARALRDQLVESCGVMVVGPRSS